MKILKGLFFTLVTLLLILFVGGFLLPQQQKIERSTLISASLEEVFQQISSPQAFNQWSPWAQIDPGTKYDYSGPQSGKGASMRWTSDNKGVGSGSWTIVNVVDQNHVDIELDFGSQGVASSSFDLEEQAEGTLIHWYFSNDAGMNPIDRWIGLLLDGWIGADYEKGLSNLKKILEKH